MAIIDELDFVGGGAVPVGWTDSGTKTAHSSNTSPFSGTGELFLESADTGAGGFDNGEVFKTFTGTAGLNRLKVRVSGDFASSYNSAHAPVVVSAVVLTSPTVTNTGVTGPFGTWYEWDFFIASASSQTVFLTVKDLDGANTCYDKLEIYTNDTAYLPGAGSLVLTGKQPLVKLVNIIRPGVGALHLTGFAPAYILVLNTFMVGKGSMALTGFNSSFLTSYHMMPGTPLVLNGFGPTVTAWYADPSAGGVWTPVTDGADVWTKVSP